MINQSIRKVLILAAAAALGAMAFASPAGASTAKQRYIVILKDFVANPASIARTQTEQRDARLRHVYDAAVNGYAASMTPEQAVALERSPNVKYVETDDPVELFAQTIPTGIKRAFVLEHALPDIDEADDVRIDADVAVIDTGVDFKHEDLNVFGNSNPEATYSWVNCLEADPLDENPLNDDCKAEVVPDGLGHGTHVAGTVGALDNGTGVVGVAPGVRIWSAKAFSDSGGGGPTGVESAVLAAFNWVYENAAKIEAVNMSFGGKEESKAWKEAIADSVDKGVIFVAAAGNFDQDAADFTPAGFADVITVSALADYDGLPEGASAQNCEPNTARGADDTLAKFSNWGDPVDIAAPGVCINSTLPMGGSLHGKEYGRLSGTSMAAPHVAGAAALLASQSNPNSRSDVEAIRQKLISDGSLNWNDNSGDGAQEPLLDLRPPSLEVITRGATNLQSSSATLNGLVNPGGIAASYKFEYGTTTAYGSSAPASPQSVGSGTKDVKVSQAVKFEPDTTYHYRVALTNSKGTFYGEDRTLEVSAWSGHVLSASKEANDLHSVSCTSSMFCMALGSRSGAALPTSTKRWDGEEWGTLSVPLPPKALSIGLENVSCSSPTFCMIVGWYAESAPGAFGSDNKMPMAAFWDGSSWTATQPLIPGGASIAEMYGVSCLSATWCAAAGTYVSGTATESGFPVKKKSTLIEVWDGTKWTIHTSPNNEEKTQNELIDVSCTSTTACVAVGYARSGLLGKQSVMLAEHWDGGKWTIQSTPKPTTPSKLTDSAFTDVSCATPSRCVAVGNTNGYGEVEPRTGFLSSWDGKAWQVGASDLSSSLYGVSCGHINSCHAVGGTLDGYWDGSQLLAKIFALPDEGSQLRIKDVSCASPYVCKAVGQYYAPRQIGEGFRPLAEHLLIPSGGIVANKYPVNLNLTSYSEANFTIPGVLADVYCQTPYIGLQNVKGQIAVAPMAAELGKCGLGGKETIKFNGCKIELRAGSENSFDIGPPGCGPITGLQIGGCHNLSIGAQTGLPATFQNVTKEGQERILISINTSLKATYTNCGGGSTATKMVVNWEIGGFNEVESPIDIRALDGFNGFFIAGQKSESEAEQPKFSAESYPAAPISGALHSGTTFRFTLPGLGEVNCNTAQFGSELAAASKSFDVGASLANCIYGKASAATVAMSSCYFKYSLANAGGGGSYSGGTSLACLKEGDAVEVVANGCTAKIAPQSPTSAITFISQGSGASRHVIANANVENVNFAFEKGICVLLGKNQKGGKLSWGSRLFGPQ